MYKKIIAVLITSMCFAVTAFADNSYSKWAESSIKEAVAEDIVPKSLQSEYTKPITREEFCNLIFCMLDKVDKSIGKQESNIHYSDTEDKAVLTASALGIVAGMGNNSFDPNGNITRQQASRMLYMASTVPQRFPELKECFSDKLIEMNSAVIMPHIFRDGYKIQSWAQESINYCYMYGIMQGSDNNLFDVDGTYSREQAIATVLRLYKLYSQGITDIPQREYIYAQRKNDDSWTYINEKGEQVIILENEYVAEAAPFRDGFAVLDYGPTLGQKVINTKGDITAEGFDHGNVFGCIAALENSKGAVNMKTGEIIGGYTISPELLSCGVGETLAAVPDINMGLYGYYNTEGQLIIPRKYKEAYPFCNGKAIVRDNEGYKLIDRFGTVLTAFSPNVKDTHISNAMGELYILKNANDKYYAVGKAGKGIILKADGNIGEIELMKSGDIRIYNEKNDEYCLYDSNGKMIFSNNGIIYYYEDADVYAGWVYFSGAEGHYYIYTRQGIKIAETGHMGYGIIGNGLLYVINENAGSTDIYDNKGNKLWEIPERCMGVRADNGVLFVTDINNNSMAYTYMGDKLLPSPQKVDNKENEPADNKNIVLDTENTTDIDTPYKHRYIGCNVYIFKTDDNMLGIMDNKGNIIVEPKYFDSSILYDTTYAYNDTVTLEDKNKFDIYDTKGNLKKSIDSPLGYELAEYSSDKYPECYYISGVSGSNIVVKEYIGDMSSEMSPEEENFIIRLYSEKKAGENYYRITPLPNGCFAAIDRETDKGVILGPDGELKQELNRYLSPNYYDNMVMGKYILGYYEHSASPNVLCDLIDENGNVVFEKIYPDDISWDYGNEILKVEKDGKETVMKGR